MATCDMCGNDYDKTFQITLQGKTHTFDSFECAIHALAPTCPHCGVRIVGHGVEQGETSSAAPTAPRRVPAGSRTGPRGRLRFGADGAPRGPWIYPGLFTAGHGPSVPIRTLETCVFGTDVMRRSGRFACGRLTSALSSGSSWSGSRRVLAEASSIESGSGGGSGLLVTGAGETGGSVFSGEYAITGTIGSSSGPAG